MSSHNRIHPIGTPSMKQADIIKKRLINNFGRQSRIPYQLYCMIDRKRHPTSEFHMQIASPEIQSDQQNNVKLANNQVNQAFFDDEKDADILIDNGLVTLKSFLSNSEEPALEIQDQSELRIDQTSPLNSIFGLVHPSKAEESAPLKEKDIQSSYSKSRKSEKTPRNANQWKFSIRIFRKYLSGYRKYFSANDQAFLYLRSRLDEIDLKERQNPTVNCIKQAHFKEFFSDPNADFPEIVRINREVMHRIYSRYLRAEVIQNSHLQNKLDYLVASKVHRLRCQNQQLVIRFTSR